ncbi:hypothetical protein SAY87_003523 [Trapa incisa]|uniref:Di19 zinc-binding domain-containing protein n=1 Tax=Trapa incisa TaxID=236973 RepID=A0AAN7KSQ0_9MYRT|nr:hypothetical protein SAY87_003523 [Trapa incisa]
MDADSWNRLSSAPKRYPWYLHTRSDMSTGFEETDGDDEVREEFPCPFCSEYFDIVGLCCHIDEEHHIEAKNGVLLDPTNLYLAIWGNGHVSWKCFYQENPTQLMSVQFVQ